MKAAESTKADMKATTTAKVNGNMKLIELAKDIGDVGFARIIRTNAYERIFPGIAVELSWWSRLEQNEKYKGMCVALAVSRPGVTLTKLSAAVALGGLVRGEPGVVTIAAIPGHSASHSRLETVKVGALPKYGELVKQRVTLGKTSTFGRADPAGGMSRKPSQPHTSGSSGRTDSVVDTFSKSSRTDSVVDTFGKPGTPSSPGAPDRIETYEVLCTSPACTIYDVAAACSCENALITINSLLLAQSNKSKLLPESHAYCEKGKYSSYLNNKAVADILRAKTFASFKTQAGHYRQHGFRYEDAAALIEECLALVWKNRGKRGVRKALFALLLASDKSESPGESLICERFYELGYVQPYQQIVFYKENETWHAVYRADGAWDLRSLAQRKQKPFARRVPFGGTAPPGSRQALLYEFDGRIKYEDERILDGKTKGEVLEAQIKRENELRDMGYELVRFTWAELYSLDRLREKLARFGIPRRVRKPARPK